MAIPVTRVNPVRAPLPASVPVCHRHDLSSDTTRVHVRCVPSLLRSGSTSAAVSIIAPPDTPSTVCNLCQSPELGPVTPTVHTNISNTLLTSSPTSGLTSSSTTSGLTSSSLTRALRAHAQLLPAAQTRACRTSTSSTRSPSLTRALYSYVNSTNSTAPA